MSASMRVQIVKTFKGNELLKGVSWECKKGDRLGLVGVNGAGKTTQLQIVMGNLDPDSGHVLKSRRNLHIGFLQQEFDIVPERTVREELASAFAEGMAVLERTEEIQKELEECTDDMERMSQLLDELDKLSNKAVDLDMTTLDKQIEQMMPQLGFSPQDNNRCAILHRLPCLHGGCVHIGSVPKCCCCCVRDPTCATLTSLYPALPE